MRQTFKKKQKFDGNKQEAGKKNGNQLPELVHEGPPC